MSLDHPHFTQRFILLGGPIERTAIQRYFHPPQMKLLLYPAPRIWESFGRQNLGSCADGIVDGRNPAPPQKPWLKPLFVDVCWQFPGNRMIPGFLNGGAKWISPIHNRDLRPSLRRALWTARRGRLVWTTTSQRALRRRVAEASPAFAQ